MEDKKDLEVVSGDGSNLDISPVYDNINEMKPRSTHNNKPTNIVIPKESKKNKKKDKKKEENM